MEECREENILLIVCISLPNPHTVSKLVCMLCYVYLSMYAYGGIGKKAHLQIVIEIKYVYMFIYGNVFKKLQCILFYFFIFKNYL